MREYILNTRTDDIFNEGMEQGISQGISQGVSQGHNTRGIEDAMRMSEDGLSPEKIAQYVGEDVKTVEEWLSSPVVLA